MANLNETVSFGSFSRDFLYAEKLMDEVIAGNSEGVKSLLQGVGASPNIVVPEWGVAALHLMAGQEDEDFGMEVTQAALLAGGDPNVKSEEGLTPVHVAAIWGRCRILQVLLCAGGDPYLQDFRLELTPGQYAFKYNQMRAYNIVTTYQVILEDQQRFAKYLSHEPFSSCTAEEIVMETTLPHPKHSWVCENEIDYCRLKNTDLKLPKQSEGKSKGNRKQMNDDDSCTTKELIIRRNTALPKCKDTCISEDVSGYDRPRNTDRKLPKAVIKQLEQKQREMYICNYEEAIFESKQTTRGTRSPSEFSDSESNVSESRRLETPDNKMLCKMSRIFLFMLRKRRVSHSISKQ